MNLQRQGQRRGKGTDEDGGGGELRDEFRDTEAARGRTGNVEGKSEWRQDNLNREVEDVDDGITITLAENLVPNLHELLHCLHQTLSRTRHGCTHHTHSHSLRG